MTAKSDQEILEYGYRIIERGDGYRSLYKYIKTHRKKEEEINALIKKVKEVDNKMVLSPRKKPKTKNPTNLVIGVSIILLGIFLIFYLWERGFIATLPFILIGIGITALSRASH